MENVTVKIVEKNDFAPLPVPEGGVARKRVPERGVIVNAGARTVFIPVSILHGLGYNVIRKPK